MTTRPGPPASKLMWHRWVKKPTTSLSKFPKRHHVQEGFFFFLFSFGSNSKWPLASICSDLMHSPSLITIVLFLLFKWIRLEHFNELSEVQRISFSESYNSHLPLAQFPYTYLQLQTCIKSRTCQSTIKSYTIHYRLWNNINWRHIFQHLLNLSLIHKTIIICLYLNVSLTQYTELTR